MMLYNDYFAPDALIEPYFHSQFRMQRHVFEHIYRVVRAYDEYFKLKKDVVENTGFSNYQCTAL